MPPPLSLQSATDRVPPTHPADGGGPEWPPTDMGWDTSVADSGPTRPPFVFRHPSPLRPAARLFGLSLIPFPSR